MVVRGLPDRQVFDSAQDFPYLGNRVLGFEKFLGIGIVGFSELESSGSNLKDGRVMLRDEVFAGAKEEGTPDVNRFGLSVERLSL